MDDNRSLLVFWIGRYLVQFPVLLAAMAAVLVVLARRRQSSQGSAWALFGFGLAFLVGLAIPIAQTAAERWIFQVHDTRAQMGYLLTGLAFFWNLLHATVYILLLVAVFAGRASSQTTLPPPLPGRDVRTDPHPL